METGDTIVLRMEENAFNDAPAIDRDDNETLANAEWSTANSAYFDEHVLQGFSRRCSGGLEVTFSLFAKSHGSSRDRRPDAGCRAATRD